MTDKAYIVVNEQQEQEVLEKLEQKGYVWSGGEKPTEWIPSKHFFTDDNFPIAIINDLSKHITFDSDYNDFNDEQHDVIYGGREEEVANTKMRISKEVYDALVEWKNEHDNELEVSLTKLVGPHEVTYLSSIVPDWWLDSSISNKEGNNRLIAIIRWVNGEDVFEVEKPKKWIVRYKETDCEEISWYIFVVDRFNFNHIINVNDIEKATKFDTKEEAESWTNAHQEVLEVEV